MRESEAGERMRGLSKKDMIQASVSAAQRRTCSQSPSMV